MSPHWNTCGDMSQCGVMMPTCPHSALCAASSSQPSWVFLKLWFRSSCCGSTWWLMDFLPPLWASTLRTWTSWTNLHATPKSPSSLAGSSSDTWPSEVQKTVWCNHLSTHPWNHPSPFTTSPSLRVTSDSVPAVFRWPPTENLKPVPMMDYVVITKNEQLQQTPASQCSNAVEQTYATYRPSAQKPFESN